ncbi:MAG: FG-GAP repeat protein, partial [Pseudomonadota bacterium]
DLFGSSVALSGDGSTLAVSAGGESSTATGINGDQADFNAATSGAVYVFIRTGIAWTQQAYVKASNTGADDTFGYSVALSSDGSTLAVGALGEDSSATGINGDGTDNGANNSGAAYIFTRTGVTWTQQAYVKASNTGAGDNFGRSVALSADGTTLAVGAYLEASAATGIDGDGTNNSSGQSGAVYVFTRTGVTWAQQAYVKASNTETSDQFGYSVALSGDGNTLVVGAYGEGSNATGISGNQSNNSALGAGAAYVFTRTGVTWTPQAYVKASNTGALDRFSISVALSSDGSTLAVGAYLEASTATGINGNGSNNGAGDSGAVYIYQYAIK